MTEGVEKGIKGLLHSSRDCLRNQDKDTSKITFFCRNDYYAEAFGIMRCLQIFGYGYFGADSGVRADEDHPKRNLKH